MESIRNWYRWRRHGLRVNHILIDGVDIQITTFRDAELDERLGRPAYGPFDPEPVLPN
jgi:hypothetical protein